jgi:uncharacterized protein (DUF488 family)
LQYNSHDGPGHCKELSASVPRALLFSEYCPVGVIWSAIRSTRSGLEIYTIGFTRKSAREFFERIRASGARSLTDVRRHPDSQLSGFAKGRDLAYFLPALAGISYRLEQLLAPSPGLLAAYRDKTLNWSGYEQGFFSELTGRCVEAKLRRKDLDATILLCSEPTAERCHRRLCVEYLSRHWGAITRIDL